VNYASTDAEGCDAKEAALANKAEPLLALPESLLGPPVLGDPSDLGT